MIRRRLRGLRHRASILMIVLLIVSLGTVLAYTYVTMQLQETVDFSLLDATQRAAAAAETGAKIAIENIRTYDMVTAPYPQGTLEDNWEDYWPGLHQDGTIIEFGDVQLLASASPVDAVAIEVSRYDDDDSFHYNPEYYRIVSIGVARDYNGINLAYYPIEAIVHVPRTDYFFHNGADFSYDENTVSTSYALITSGAASDGQGVPAYVAQNTFLGGSIYSYRVPKIHGYVDGYAFYESESGSLHDPDPPSGPPYAGDNCSIEDTDPKPDVVCPAALTREFMWRDKYAFTAEVLMARPTLDISDYGFNTDLTYSIDGVTFTARRLTAPEDVSAGGVLTADRELQLGASRKTNPANVLVYDKGNLFLDCDDYSISMSGTLVAFSIYLYDSSETTDPESGVDFHFVPAIEGFPSLACYELNLGWTADQRNTSYDSTFIDGPVLVRHYINGKGQPSGPGSFCGGATINGFVVSNMVGTDYIAGSGFSPGGFKPRFWDDPSTGYVGSANPDINGKVLILAEENGIPGPYTRLRLVNGQQGTASKGIFGPDNPTTIRVRRGDKSIVFTKFQGAWQDYIAD